MTFSSPFVLAVAVASALVLGGCAAGSPATSSPATSGPASAGTSAAAAPSSPAAAPTTAPAAAAGPRECGNGQLKTAYTDNRQISSGALDGMSHHDSVVMFTNVGSGPCWTRGYPGVALLNSAGKQVKQAVRQAGMGPEPRITLNPGQRASAELLGDSASCRTYPRIAGLLVTAPDQTASTRLGPPAQPLCLNSVTIGWVVRGNGGGTGS